MVRNKKLSRVLSTIVCHSNAVSANGSLPVMANVQRTVLCVISMAIPVLIICVRDIASFLSMSSLTWTS